MMPKSNPNGQAGRAYAVLGMLFLLQTLNFFDKLVFGLSAVPIMAELHVTPKLYGLIGSSFYLLFPISGSLVGFFLIGRWRSKSILLTLALIWSATQFSVAASGSIAVLLACRLILGLGEGPGLPTALHSCYEWFAPSRRHLPSAVVLQGISAGYLIGSPVLTYFIVHFGWHAGFLACGLLGSGWALAWLLIGAAGPHAVSAATPDDDSFIVPARALWLDPTIIGVTIMSFMSYYVVGMTATWLPPYLQLGLGYRPVPAGWIIAAVFAFQSPLLLAGAWASQALQRRGWTIRAAVAQAGTATLLVAGLAMIAATHSLGVPRLMLIAVGFAAPSLTTVFGPVILGVVAPPAERGKLIVVIYSANAFAGLISTSATGWIVDAAGADHAAGFARAISVAGIMLIAGAFASWAMIHPERAASRLARAGQR